MASTNPSMVSDPNEQKWVSEIEEILNHLLEINVEIPHVSVCQLPETITTKKPEAYEPQQVGVGPIHHFRPQTYKKMEQKKLDAVRKVLRDYEIKDYKVTVLDKVRKLVPVVRSCYDMFLQGDDDSLAWIFSIDGIFLLNLFRNYGQVDPRRRLLAQDIMMVENQIPLMVLKEIDGALYQSAASNSSHSANTFSPSIFRSFCENHSPLNLCPASQSPTSVDHLLHYMYYSIVNNLPVNNLPMRLPRPPIVAGSSRPAQLATDFVMKLPTKEIVQVYEQTISALETFTQSKILIPSASKLRDRAGFSFFYQDFQKVSMEGDSIYLPPLTLNSDSEVILRNLIAYESLINNSNNSPLAEYMGLMCALIVNVEDAKYLREKDVIKGLTMKSHSLLKKLARWLLVGLRAIGVFVEGSWKIVAFIVSIVTVFMLTWKAYCDVYGCDKTAVTLLPYASS
nr:hypothetical protein [Tanacetum cinerariifolium]